MTPGMIGVDRVAAVCGCPEAFVPLLSRHGLLPPLTEDGLRVAAVSAAIRRTPWLRRLGTPVSEGEAIRLLGPGFDVPDDGASMAGRVYAPLWRVLAHSWRRDASSVA